MLELHLQDNEYPYQGLQCHRLVVRGIVLNERGHVALHRVKRDDIFGNQEYFETPGGGVDEGETLEIALKRECQEELGEEIEPLLEIGLVHDAYNLIKRENENHYFLCKKLGEGHKHFVSDGDFFIQETLWIPIQEAITLMKNQPDSGVSALVKARELPILEEAAKILG